MSYVPDVEVPATRARFVDLCRWSWRSMARWTFAVFGAAAVAQARRGGLDDLSGVAVAALVAVPAAASFDDPLTPFVGSSPTPLRRRVGARVALVSGLAAVTWVLAASAARAAGRPAVVMSLAPVAFVAVVIAASAAGMSRPLASRGASGAAALLAMTLLVMTLPGRLALFPEHAHRASWLVMVAGACTVVVHLSRDPAARHRVGVRRRR